MSAICLCLMFWLKDRFAFSKNLLFEFCFLQTKPSSAKHLASFYPRPSLALVLLWFSVSNRAKTVLQDYQSQQILARGRGGKRNKVHTPNQRLCLYRESDSGSPIFQKKSTLAFGSLMSVRSKPQNIWSGWKTATKRMKILSKPTELKLLVLPYELL